jgi:hypothetical protein
MICFFSGCGGGSSKEKNGDLDDITGTWAGNFVINEVADSSHKSFFVITAELIQTDTSFSGTFIIAMFGIESTSGVFDASYRRGNSLGGVMDDGGQAWSTVAVFSGSITGTTMTISGTVRWPGWFDTDLVSFVAVMDRAS